MEYFIVIWISAIADHLLGAKGTRDMNEWMRSSMFGTREAINMNIRAEATGKIND